MSGLGDLQVEKMMVLDPRNSTCVLHIGDDDHPNLPSQPLFIRHGMSSRQAMGRRDAATYSAVTATSPVRIRKLSFVWVRSELVAVFRCRMSNMRMFRRLKTHVKLFPSLWIWFPADSPTCLIFRLDRDSLRPVSTIFIHDSASSEVFASRRRLSQCSIGFSSKSRKTCTRPRVRRHCLQNNLVWDGCSVRHKPRRREAS